MRTIVIMPGGFHPFHAGHAALYKSAVEAFSNADVYVAATNDTKTRPFPFAIKEKLAKLAGVADKHFVQVKSPFKSEEITQHYNPNEDVLVFVRSEKDKTEQPKPGGTKKDGSPAYFQPWTGKNLQPFSKHAYIAYLPTVEFGPGITSATEIRNAWPTLNDKRKTAMVMSLYPVTQKNPKLAANVVKMLDMGMGGQENMAEGKLIESAVFLNPTTVIVGQAHGQPLELSPNTLKQIQAIAAKHGAYYEGNGTDRAYTKGQIDRYVGSWDDEVAKTANPNDPKWLYVLFANVDANNRVQRVGVDPKDTIFNRLLATAKDNSFQGIGYTSQALQKFLQMSSEGKYDFVKMSQQPATQENLTRFLKAGEALMWPSNWEQYPNKAGKIAKAATVDVRDQYLATRKAGVYVTGSGHLKAVQNITGKQGVAEGSQRVDSLVSDALKIMKGPEVSDAVAALKTVLGDREFNGRRGFYNFYIKQMLDMYGQQGSLKEFAPGNGGGESGRWYTDDQMTDLVGDGWWNDLDVSGDIPKQQMIQQAQAWLDDQGYSVHVLNCKLNDDDMDWFIEGSFQNSNFAKKGVAEGSLNEFVPPSSDRGDSGDSRSRRIRKLLEIAIQVAKEKNIDELGMIHGMNMIAGDEFFNTAVEGILPDITDKEYMFVLQSAYKTVKQGLAEAKKKRKKKSKNRSLGRYFFPGYSYYGGSGESGEGGGDGGGEGMAEGVPQPGPSSGAPKQFGADAQIQTRQMTVKDIISSVPGVPYYNNVVDDWDTKDYSWGVTKKVIEYATYLKDHPESLSKLPPAIVLNGKFEDGAHRVSAIWLLQQRMDPKNPLWKNAKLNVQFVKQGMTEGDVVPLKQPSKTLTWDQVPRDVLLLANDWFWASEDNSGLAATIDPEGFGNGTANDVKYNAAKLQQKGWTIDFNDEYDGPGEFNLRLTNKRGQSVLLSIEDAQDFTGWAEGTSSLNEGPFVQRIMHPKKVSIYLRLGKGSKLVATDIPYEILDSYVKKVIQKYPQFKPTDFSFKSSDKVDENLGIPYPTTYEQENNKFKRRGPMRITDLTEMDQDYLNEK